MWSCGHVVAGGEFPRDLLCALPDLGHRCRGSQSRNKVAMKVPQNCKVDANKTKGKLIKNMGN